MPSESLFHANSRPLQTGLFEGDDRAVGPMPQSFVLGDNSALIASIAPLYLTGSVLDVTYGRGVWWRRFSPASLGKHDLVLDGVDFRALPDEDESWDAVCFDPPYIPTRAAHTASPLLKGRFRPSYGLETPRTRVELDTLIAAGLAECARVSRRWVLMKCCDYAETKDHFVLGHVSAIAEGQRIGLRVHDLLVHAGGTGPGGSRIRELRRARRAHSYLVVFAKPRRRARKAAT
jgi:hypothetical protein